MKTPTERKKAQQRIFQGKTGIITPRWRDLEKRKYLTLNGIKNWDELTPTDKLSLNINP